MSNIQYKGQILEVGKWYLTIANNLVLLEGKAQLHTNPTADAIKLRHLNGDYSYEYSDSLKAIPEDMIGIIEEWAPVQGQLYAFFDKSDQNSEPRFAQFISKGAQSKVFYDSYGFSWKYCRPITEEEWKMLRGEE